MRNQPEPDVVEATRAAIERTLATARLDIHTVASTVGTNVRTLQRRLAAAGTTYSQLVDGVRRNQAARLLLSPNLTTVEIATTLGYSDVAHFSRAFARWTGTTPGVYRRRGHLANLPQSY